MDRRQFLSSTSQAAVALSLPAGIAASDMPADLTELPASQLSAAIRQRHAGCVEVMQAYLERIRRYNPVYNALVSMREEDELLREAAHADQALAKGEYRGWMHGMPHAVKDLANARGLHTCWGSPIFADTVSGEDDLHIARIRAQRGLRSRGGRI